VEVSAGELGLGLVGATLAGVTAHGLIGIMKSPPKPPPSAGGPAGEAPSSGKEN
jgi:hypothetical protein